jgi:6-methylsalicylate decarboxylase
LFYYSSDNIDLTVLSFLDEALSEIKAVNESASTRRSLDSGRLAARQFAGIIDVHSKLIIFKCYWTFDKDSTLAHVVPSWFKALVPITGGNPTPDWDLDSYLDFMAAQGISRSVFSFSAPGANVYQGQKGLTVALARLINEQSAAYARAYPNKLDFYAIVPLPYTQEAIVESKYALEELGAAGIFLTSNFEGKYLGNTQFKPFFDALNKRAGRQIVYVHPSAPYVNVNNKLVEANPTPYPTGNIEF